MKQHVSILGILFVTFGVFGLLAAVAVLALFGGIAGLVGLGAVGDPDAVMVAPILGILAVGVFLALAALSLPGLVVGIGLLKRRGWARTGGLILAALNLLNVPFGTALGAYGLWVLLSRETEAEFP